MQDESQEPPQMQAAPGWYSDPAKPKTQRYWDGTQWTTNTQAKKRGVPRPHWRKMTWAIVIWSVVMAIWIIAGIASSNNGQECAHEAHRYLSQSGCTSLRNAGTGIAVVGLWFIWFFGFIILSLIWFMTRPRGRVCPACGERVKKGRTACPECGHDFAAAATAPPPVAPAA